MFDLNGLVSMAVFVSVFFATMGLASLLLARFEGDRRRARVRLRELAAPGERAPERSSVTDLALAALPKLGSLLLPGEGNLRLRLQRRLNVAGLYGPQAIPIFLGAQLLLALVLPAVTVLVPYLCDLLSGRVALGLGVVAMGVGVVLPGSWVDARRNRRRATFQRGLPDFLDMLVLCVEGGVSLPAALQRVTGEMQAAHPLLAGEMNIVEREMQLGLTAGEALRKLGERCGLEDVRNLASVLLQSERYGASIVKALRIHADTCRLERQQLAEEMAQKAGVKILFPTLLCIFPATFIVVLGPAAYQIANMFANTK